VPSETPTRAKPVPEHATALAELRVLLRARRCESAVAIGTFDGVHAGHRSLLRHTSHVARERGITPIAMTFSPRPDRLLAPERALPDLCSLDERIARLHEAGAAEVVVVPFSRELGRVSARAFVTSLVEDLGAVLLCVGEDFALGRGREGTVEAIRSMGLEVLTPPLVLDAGGRKLSSSQLRRARASLPDTGLLTTSTSEAR
jgi:riboflavin kinase/FMN adenylyltransferase